MTDEDWLALNVYMEARGEGADGRAAVARVTLNRARLPYFSDGTVTGAVTRRDQFSWLWFDMVGGRYARVCSTYPAALSRGEQLLSEVEENRHPPVALSWAACRDAAAEVLAGTYEGGDGYRQLTDATVLYYNPALVAAPAWATPELQDAVIGHHAFYHTEATLEMMRERQSS